MNSDRHIVITGFMGSGKTTVARGLALILEREMLDLDQVIASQEGRTAKEIIEQDGERSFRNIETSSLRGLLERSLPSVIALGGGAWTIERNRAIINQHGCVTVWLDAPFELCWDRILSSGGGRPLARDEQQARVLHAERRLQYALAKVQVHVSPDKSPDDIATEISAALQVLDN